MPPIPAKKPVAAPAKAAPADNVITPAITVSRSFTVPMGNASDGYASVKFGISVTGTDYETVSEQVGAYMAAEAEKAGAQYTELTGGEAGDDAGDDAGTEGAAEGDDEATGDEDVTPESIMAMNRDALIALVTENDLPVDPDDFSKNAKGLGEFRQAVVDAAFDNGEEQITEEAIREMDRPTLVKFIADNAIDVDAKKHTKLSALHNAVVEAMVAAADEDADADADADAGDDTAADDAGDAYTAETLGALTITDLKAIYTEWELGPFPAGPPVKQKPLAIKAILAAQAG